MGLLPDLIEHGRSLLADARSPEEAAELIARAADDVRDLPDLRPHQFGSWRSGWAAQLAEHGDEPGAELLREVELADVLAAAEQLVRRGDELRRSRLWQDWSKGAPGVRVGAETRPWKLRASTSEGRTACATPSPRRRSPRASRSSSWRG